VLCILPAIIVILHQKALQPDILYSDYFIIMLINTQKLINLPVITKSGHHIGTVVDININTDYQNIVSYIVRPTTLIQGLFKGNLTIDRGQIIDITTKNIIVYDNFCTKKSMMDILKQKFNHKKAVVINKG